MLWSYLSFAFFTSLSHLVILYHNLGVQGPFPYSCIAYLQGRVGRLYTTNSPLRTQSLTSCRKHFLKQTIYRKWLFCDLMRATPLPTSCRCLSLSLNDYILHVFQPYFFLESLFYSLNLNTLVSV